MKFHTYILLLFIGLYSIGVSQNEANFNKQITELNTLGKEIIGSESDSLRFAANEKYKTILKEITNNNASFDYQFDSLKTISILQTHNLKIYNWVLPLTDGTYEYFAFLQIKKSKEIFNIVELTDKSESIKSPERKTLTQKNWYGALYHRIIHHKKIGENYYTLLGWDGNNKLTNKKIIDVVNISNSKMIKFGAPIFKTAKQTKRRIIFEYSKNAVMSLKYHPDLEKIVFDYLVPASSKLKGIYEYYGPSLDTFDAFLLDKGKWVYEKNTEIMLYRSIKDNMWKKPEKAIIR